MDSFDFADSAADGYRFFWHARRDIMRMALIPLVIKVISLSAVVGFDITENYLRQGLVLLPSYFVEGWLLAKIIRMAILGERIEQQLTGHPDRDFNLLRAHVRPVAAAAIIYTLIKLCMALLTAFFMMIAQSRTPEPSSDAASLTAMTAFALLALIIWGFRFLWLYIPAALGYSVQGFLLRIRGYMSSVYMVATWLLCFVPMAILLLGGLQVLGSIFPDTQAAAYSYIVIVWQAVIEIMVVVIVSVAMAFGIQSLYNEAR